jgi:LPXTG-motif cell wall-anchored protein
MRIFEREGYDYEPGDEFASPGLCSLFDLGNKASGQSVSTGTNEAILSFVPSVNISDAAGQVPLVSPFPAGLGLATLNTAYPGSAIYGGVPTAQAVPASSGLSTTTLLLVGLAVAGGAWFLLRKKRK